MEHDFDCQPQPAHGDWSYPLVTRLLYVSPVIPLRAFIRIGN